MIFFKFGFKVLEKNCLKKRGKYGKTLLNYISQDGVNLDVDCNGVSEDVSALRGLMLTTI
jgi:hypothetical protein